MRRASLGDVMRYGAVLAALLPAAKSCWTRVDPLNLLLLVPLYFTLIPVLTHLVLGEMWDWNTRTSNFERFDVTAHPVAGKLLMLFYTVCSAVFVYLVLTFDPGRIK